MTSRGPLKATIIIFLMHVRVNPNSVSAANEMAEISARRGALRIQAEAPVKIPAKQGIIAEGEAKKDERHR